MGRKGVGEDELQGAKEEEAEADSEKASAYQWQEWQERALHSYRRSFAATFDEGAALVCLVRHHRAPLWEEVKLPCLEGRRVRVYPRFIYLLEIALSFQYLNFSNLSVSISANLAIRTDYSMAWYHRVYIFT